MMNYQNFVQKLAAKTVPAAMIPLTMQLIRAEPNHFISFIPIGIPIAIEIIIKGNITPPKLSLRSGSSFDLK